MRVEWYASVSVDFCNQHSFKFPISLSALGSERPFAAVWTNYRLGVVTNSFLFSVPVCLLSISPCWDWTSERSRAVLDAIGARNSGLHSVPGAGSAGAAGVETTNGKHEQLRQIKGAYAPG